MFILIRSIFCLALFFGLGRVIAQDTLTLERCIALALENNLDVQQGRIRTQGEAINYRQSKQNLLPGLSGSIDHGIQKGRGIDPETNQYRNNVVTESGSPGLNSSMILFDGLRMFRSITQQAYAYRATQAEEQLLNEQIALDVTATYIDALAARDMVVQIENQLSVTREQVNRSTIMHEEGAISPSDFYDLKGQYASELNTLNEADNALSGALIRLFGFLNLPFNGNIHLTSLQQLPLAAGEASTPDLLYGVAAERLGIIKAADYRKAEAEYALKASRASYFPTLSVGAGMSSSYIKGNGTYLDQVQDQDRLGQSVNFSLAIPIFSRFQARNNVSRAKLNLLNATYVAEKKRNDLQQITNQVLLNLDAAKDRYQNLLEQVNYYSESFRIAAVRFDAGDINSVEFLIAKNKVDNANANLVIARYQWHLRQRIVDYYNGEMFVGQH